MVEVPTLSDGVVTLRRHSEHDVERCLEQCIDPVSIQWTTVPVPYTRDDARRFVRHVMPGGWASDQEWGFAVEHEGRYAGTVSLRNEGEGRAEIAYGSHPDARGTGVMERALRLLVAWGFSPASAGGRELRSVVWWADVGNWASRKLAWRLGFDLGGQTVRRWLPQRGELRDAWVGTLLADDERVPRTRWLESPVLELGDLRLRPLADGDVPRIVEACSDPRSRHWMRQLPEPYQPADAAAWILQRRLGNAAAESVTWAVTDARTDLMLGAVDLFGLDFEDGQAEVGYWTHPDARGRGVATAGARAAVRHGLIDVEDGGLGLLRVHATAAVDNIASRHALVAAGMREVGVERAAMRIGGCATDAVLHEATAGDLR